MLIITSSFHECNLHMLKYPRHLKVVLTGDKSSYWYGLFSSLHVRLRRFVVFIVFTGTERFEADNDLEETEVENILFFMNNFFIKVVNISPYLEEEDFIEVCQFVSKAGIKGKKYVRIP